LAAELVSLTILLTLFGGFLGEQLDTVLLAHAFPAARCGLMLMSESTSDRLFRQVADTWLGLA
jgi:hypothetical protein